MKINQKSEGDVVKERDVREDKCDGRKKQRNGIEGRGRLSVER